MMALLDLDRTVIVSTAENPDFKILDRTKCILNEELRIANQRSNHVNRREGAAHKLAALQEAHFFSKSTMTTTTKR
jgi:hypothetical protein